MRTSKKRYRAASAEVLRDETRVRRTRQISDGFDEFLKTPPRRSRVCQTCADGGKPVDYAARWVANAKAGKPGPSLRQLYEYLVENVGYRWSHAAISQHVRSCLGYRACGR